MDAYLVKYPLVIVDGRMGWRGLALSQLRTILERENMTIRTITVHDRCTVEGCNHVLHSIAEGVRGLCSSCHFKQQPTDTKQALNKLIASAFNGSTEEQRGAAVQDAMDKLKRDGEKNDETQNRLA